MLIHALHRTSPHVLVFFCYEVWQRVHNYRLSHWLVWIARKISCWNLKQFTNFKAHANGRNKSQHCCVLLGFFWPTISVASVCMGLKVWPVSNYTQVPTLSWFHANGRNMLGPTMLCVVGQQCCVRLYGPFGKKKRCFNNIQAKFILLTKFQANSMCIGARVNTLFFTRTSNLWAETECF